jgi:hypothetical protein
MPRPHAFALVLIVAPLLMACDDARPVSPTPAASSQTPAQPAGQALPTVPEAELYRGAPLVPASVEWSVDGSCVADDQAVREVREAVGASAASIAAVDYTSLSLPRFVTLTQGLKVEPAHWQGAAPKVEIEACGSEGGAVKWHIYNVLGPEFRQPPAQPIIHRWAHVYALYSLDERAVKRLVPSIRGYVLE